MDFIKEIIEGDFFFHHSLNDKVESDLFALHMHDAFEILLFVRGRAKLNIEDRFYTLEPSDLCFIYPGRFHRVIPEAGSVYERKVIRFDYSFSRRFDPDDILINSMHNFDMIKGPDVIKTNILRSFDEMNDHISYEGELRKIACISVLSHLLLDISQSVAAASALTYESPANDRIASVIGFINRNLTEDLSLDRIAGEFFVSKFYLSRIFKENTGSSIGDFIIRKRLVLAKRLIMGGSTPRNASLQSGFIDYSSFFKHYKKHFGTSPSARQGRG